jgi:hypothetical protein
VFCEEDEVGGFLGEGRPQYRQSEHEGHGDERA